MVDHSFVFFAMTARKPGFGDNRSVGQWLNSCVSLFLRLLENCWYARGIAVDSVRKGICKHPDPHNPTSFTQNPSVRSLRNRPNPLPSHPQTAFPIPQRT